MFDIELNSPFIINILICSTCVFTRKIKFGPDTVLEVTLLVLLEWTLYLAVHERHLGPSSPWRRAYCWSAAAIGLGYPSFLNIVKEQRALWTPTSPQAATLLAQKFGTDGAFWRACMHGCATDLIKILGLTNPKHFSCAQNYNTWIVLELQGQFGRWQVKLDFETRGEG